MKTILLIEDDVRLRENLKTIMQLNKFNCVVAEDGQQGLEMIPIIKPNLILCDLMMKNKDGFEVLEATRKDPDFKKIPFILLTARAEMADRQKGYALGASEYLTKPIAAAILLQTINHWLSI
jgi:CheY-like chemotaxis protein